MEQTDFQNIFTRIQDEITNLLKLNLSDGAKVTNRETFETDEKIWLGRLKDNAGEINCWSVSYRGTTTFDGGAMATESFAAIFELKGFRGYDFGTDADNSSKKFMNDLSALRFAFLNCPRLNFEEWVNQHSGFRDRTSILNVNTQLIHHAAITLTVSLLPISYDY